jgi:hypothetical protein
VLLGLKRTNKVRGEASDSLPGQSILTAIRDLSHNVLKLPSRSDKSRLIAVHRSLIASFGVVVWTANLQNSARLDTESGQPP